jgi:hypothetical protein
MQTYHVYGEVTQWTLTRQPFEASVKAASEEEARAKIKAVVETPSGYSPDIRIEWDTYEDCGEHKEIELDDENTTIEETP